MHISVHLGARIPQSCQAVQRLGKGIGRACSNSHPPETHLKWFLSQKLSVEFFGFSLKSICRVLLFGVLCVRNLGASIRLHFICNCIPPSCLGTERLGKGIGRAYSKWHLTYPLSFHKYKKKTIQKRYKGTKVKKYKSTKV